MFYMYTYCYIFLLFYSSNIPEIWSFFLVVRSSQLGGYAKMAWLPWAAASSLNRTSHVAGSQSYGTCMQSGYADSCSSPTCARQNRGSARGHLVSVVDMSVLTSHIQHSGEETHIPGSHVSRTYLLLFASLIEEASVSASSGINRSNPVPPDESRMNRLEIGVVRCDPGRKESAPFSGVHFSSAIQNPSAVGGSVYCDAWDERAVKKAWAGLPGTFYAMRYIYDGGQEAQVSRNRWYATSRYVPELYS